AAQQARPASPLNLPPRPPVGSPPQPPRKPLTLEAKIGGSWFNIVGVLAIIIGSAFFLKYAFDSGWITPTILGMIGAAIGIGFLGAGEWLRKNYANYAYSLSGLGISLLYLTVYAATSYYKLIGQPVGMGFMSLITATAAILSARYNALAIAILGL